MIQTMSIADDLLFVSPFESQKTPLLLEVTVNLETAPYLVTNTKGGLLWLNPRKPFVRAAFTEKTPISLYPQIVDEVVFLAKEAQWGNANPLTEEGLTRSIEHLISYDIPSPEILANPDFDWSRVGGPPKLLDCFDGNTKELKIGCPVIPTYWLDTDTLVVVPRDRDYLGLLLQAKDNLNLVLVHNPSRGIAVCRK